MTSAESRTDVVVVGGGLAGISAAVDLAEAGLSVTLLEARPWLGGATCSFARRGLTIDNGQHAFLRCCGAYRDLLAKLGVASSVAIQNRLELTVLGSPDGTADAAPVGSPGAVTPGQGAGWLPAAAESRAPEGGGRDGCAAIRRSRPCKMTTSAFAEWLADRGQDENARRLLWDLLSTAALGLPGGPG